MYLVPGLVGGLTALPKQSSIQNYRYPLRPLNTFECPGMPDNAEFIEVHEHHGADGVAILEAMMGRGHQFYMFDVPNRKWLIFYNGPIQVH